MNAPTDGDHGRTSPDGEPAPRHQCMIYDGSPAKSLPYLAMLILARLAANYRCLYLNSPAMVAEMPSHLAAAGVDVAEETRRGSLVLSSDQNHLVSGRFEAAPMLSMLEETVRCALSDGYAGLFATGDLTWEFGPARNFKKLLAYELALEELFQRLPHLSGVCQYHQQLLPVDAIRTGLYAHRGVYVNDTLTRVNPYYLERALLARSEEDASREQVRQRLSRICAA